jgi:hypothetical protein
MGFKRSKSDVASLDRYLGLVGVMGKSFTEGKDAINDAPLTDG